MSHHKQTEGAGEMYTIQKCRHNGYSWELGGGRHWAVVTPEGAIYESCVTRPVFKAGESGGIVTNQETVTIPAVYRRKAAAQNEAALLNIKAQYRRRKEMAGK